MHHPGVEVAAVLVRSGGRILAEYNTRWKAFALPMARLEARTGSGLAVPELPLDAAVRAAVTALGRPLPPDGLPRPVALAEPAQPYQRSAADGRFKRYGYHPFE